MAQGEDVGREDIRNSKREQGRVRRTEKEGEGKSGMRGSWRRKRMWVGRHKKRQMGSGKGAAH